MRRWLPEQARIDGRTTTSTRRSRHKVSMSTTANAPVSLFGNLDLLGLSEVSYKLGCIEELVPSTEPPPPIVAASLEGPLHKVVGEGRFRPRPNHVGVEHAEQQLRVLSVPCPRLPVDDLPHRHGHARADAVILGESGSDMRTASNDHATRPSTQPGVSHNEAKVASSDTSLVRTQRGRACRKPCGRRAGAPYRGSGLLHALIHPSA
jgi:hypothetical protein